MAKNVGRNYPKPGMDQLQFINRKLTTDEKDTFELWFADTQKADVAITKAFHEGYKPSIQWQRDQEIFNALLFPPKDGEANKGLCISSKANNWYKAFAMCVFKHAVLAKGDWSTFVEGDSEEG